MSEEKQEKIRLKLTYNRNATLLVRIRLLQKGWWRGLFLNGSARGGIGNDRQLFPVLISPMRMESRSRPTGPLDVVFCLSL